MRILTHHLDRRRLIKVSVAAGAMSTSWRPLLADEAAADPHFFLQIFFPGGLDSRMTFDARSLAMTEAKLVVDPIKSAPKPYVGNNDGECLLTDLVKPVEKFLDRFSVINGIVMMPAFDGHENNVGYLITGNPFGGEAIMPHLNEGSARLPLDYVHVGDGMLLTSISNAGNAAPLKPVSAKNFAERLNALPSLTGESRLKSFLHTRMELAAQGRGRFSAGAEAMRSAFGQMPALAESFKSLDLGDVDGDTKGAGARLVGELFRNNVCKSALMVFDTDLSETQNLDCHDANGAKDQPRIISEIMTELSQVLDYLATTPYDATRTLLDVTTVAVGSEFGRTMRQTWVDIERSGTDHNPLTNTCLLGGKGIKGGLVIGQSDYRSPKEELSKAHKSQDPMGVKIMGRPFDFSTGRPRKDLPENYNAQDYLTYSSVANTIYQAFGLGEERQRADERNGPKAPVLSQLLG